MLINIKNSQQEISFTDAVKKGMGENKGLFIPPHLSAFNNLQYLLEMPFIQRSSHILQHLIGQEIPPDQINQMVEKAFNFNPVIKQVSQDIFCLELFHGPTLAFKDFGARFMAQCLSMINSDREITILTATSGDTGAAVAHAFYGLKNINAVILYPKGKVTPLQEKLFCTLGGNIHTFAVDGDFDDCQHMVKACFHDLEINHKLHLSSANSINIARLYAQICYYFEACAALQHNQLVISVPSGNFGNLTAGLMAKKLGAPVKKLIAATNINDTVPRFISEGQWQPKPTRKTASNAMDVSIPNNWPRIMYLLDNDHKKLQHIIQPGVKADHETYAAMKTMHKLGYTSEPHGAVAFACLQQHLNKHEIGVFLGTAHPAKFKPTVDSVLDISIPLPKELEAVKNKPILSIEMTKDIGELKQYLLQ